LSTMFMLARALQPRLTERARFASSFGRMWSAAFSPDGRQIVTTDDRSAQIWDAKTYRLLFKLDHRDEVYDAVYSSDGTRLVTVAQEAVRIWDPATGVLVHELTQKRSDGKPVDYYVGAISPDGRLVAAIDSAGLLAHVWDASTGAPLATLRNDASIFPALAFSSDSHWLATSGGDDVRVFDTVTWKPVLTIRGPRVHSLAFDPTRPRLVTGAATGDVALWAVPSGARIRHLRDVGEPVDAVAFSPDGEFVVAASRNGAEQVWRAESGELQSQFTYHHSKIRAVEFDRTSKLVLAAGSDGTVVIADAALGLAVTVLEGPQNIVRVAHFDPSSRRVVGASWDGTARVWDATAPYRRWSSPPISDGCGIIATPNPAGRFVAVGCWRRATRVWDTMRDRLLAELPGMLAVDGDFTSAFPAVSGAGDRAAIARGNVVEVYELPGGRLRRTIVHGAAVKAVAFASTGRDIVSGAIDGSLLVTRDNGAVLALPSVSGGIDVAAFLSDGRVVASDARRRLRVYDRGGALLSDIEMPVRAMSLRLNGTRLVTVPEAGSAAPPVLVDLEHYRVIAQLEGHVGRVSSARWVAGNQLVTAGGDGTARLWDGSTGQLRQTYRGSSQWLADATLSSDGRMILAGGADGVLRFWDATSGRLVWTLHAHESHVIGIYVEGDDIVTRGFAGELSRWTLPRSDQVIDACGNHERCAIVPK
jgi:WD40 repeat protein